MNESYSLMSFVIATSLLTFLENIFYTIVLVGLLVGLIAFMNAKKMFEPSTRRGRFRRR